MELGEIVGNFCNSAISFIWDNFDEDTKLSKHTLKLNNSCTVMMCILGLMVHKQLRGPIPVM